jgi:phage-related protein
MGVTQAVYYRDVSGREPVNDFINTLERAAQVAIDEKVDLLNGLPDDAPPPPFPHTSQVEGALRELRCPRGRTHYRVLYRRSGNLIILLHALVKRSASIPERDKEIAGARFADFESRMNANPRVGSRPAGHDAPARDRHRGAAYQD